MMIYKFFETIEQLINLTIVNSSEQSIGTIQANLAVEAVRNDPLIARRLEVWQYAGIIALAIALVILVRVLSPRIEHALLFAAFLSVALIIFFFTG